MIRIVLLLMVCICTTYSQTYYMNVRLKGGATTSLPVMDIQKLTFQRITPDVKDGKWATVIKLFALFQNYPNPFNPSTTIEYELPKPGSVEVRILNVAGQLVKTLDRSFQVEGPHTVIWDGKNNSGHSVASGVYFYQLSYENAPLTRKMLLIK